MANVVYAEVEDEVYEMIQDLIEDHYPDISESLLTIACFYASSEDGNPVKHHGHTAHATIEKNTPLRRSQGLKDCTILIDKSRWEKKTPRKQLGLLDHELRHVEVQRITRGEDKGEIKYDTAGRPVVSLREHDWILGGFEDIAERYGDDSPEVEAVQIIYARYQSVTRG